MKQLNISIKDGCIGCGLCASTCPNVFQMTDDGVAEVFSTPESEDEAIAQDAADNCPVSVIIVE